MFEITVLLWQKVTNQNQPTGEMHRVRSGMVPDVRLPLSSELHHPPGQLVCDSVHRALPAREASVSRALLGFTLS